MNESEMNFFDKISSFMNTMNNYIQSGFDNVDDDEYKKRLEICRGCDKFASPICTICGCIMLVKAKMDVAECPLGKWSGRDITAPTNIRSNCGCQKSSSSSS